MIELSDTDLLIRLRNCEDNFAERKTNADKAGWLRTAVAFANSLPIGAPGVLFVGVNNNGKPQDNGDLENLQKTVTQEINRACPPIPIFPKVIDENGKALLAVIIYGSPVRPHFAAKSYIRVGPQTIEASERQLDQLVAQRQDKAYELLKWKGQIVSVDIYRYDKLTGQSVVMSSPAAVVVECTQFYLTLDLAERQAFPLRRIELNYDYKNERLKIELHSI